jgi:hypothetical protein
MWHLGALLQGGMHDYDTILSGQHRWLHDGLGIGVAVTTTVSPRCRHQVRGFWID